MSKLKAIYEPKGKAKEYADLAVNLFETCRHGCVYCYAPKVMHKNPTEFFGPTKLRKNILQKIQEDAKRLQAEFDQREILLCFTSDPYQSRPGPDDALNRQTVRRVIETLLEHSLNITILTKGGFNSLVDMDILEQYPDQVRYGASLVFANRADCKIYEPNAPPTQERIEALRNFHNKGIRTWASIEPAWSLEDTLQIIDNSHKYVDAYMLGKLNYHPHAKEVDWTEYTQGVVKKLQDLDKPFYIKQDLRRFFYVNIDLHNEMARIRPGLV